MGLHPNNKVDRSPEYSINLPFNSGNGPYQVWKNESGVSYPFTKTVKPASAASSSTAIRDR